MNSKITCLVCNKVFKRITFKHLQKHGITFNGYIEKFPDAELTPLGVRKSISSGLIKTLSSVEHRLRLKEQSRNFWENASDEFKKELGDRGRKILGGKNIKVRYGLDTSLKSETKEKIRKVKTGRKRPPFSEEWKRKIRDATISRLPKMLDKLGVEKSKPHLKVKEALDTLYEDEFISEEIIGYYKCDEVNRNKKVIIEIQGCYWHGCAKCINSKNYSKMQITNRNRDKRKKTFLENLGWKVIEIWEHDIQEQDKLIEKITNLEI